MRASTVEDAAREITARVNRRIATEGKDWNPYEYRARAEAVAEEEIPSSWEWIMAESLGGLPTIALLRHDPRKD